MNRYLVPFCHDEPSRMPVIFYENRSFTHVEQSDPAARAVPARLVITRERRPRPSIHRPTRRLRMRTALTHSCAATARPNAHGLRPIPPRPCSSIHCEL
eukprot:4801557-Pleurochrysis_carterae.AAC.5